MMLGRLAAGFSALISVLMSTSVAVAVAVEAEDPFCSFTFDRYFGPRVACWGASMCIIKEASTIEGILKK